MKEAGGNGIDMVSGLAERESETAGLIRTRCENSILDARHCKQENSLKKWRELFDTKMRML